MALLALRVAIEVVVVKTHSTRDTDLVAPQEISFRTVGVRSRNTGRFRDRDGHVGDRRTSYRHVSRHGGEIRSEVSRRLRIGVARGFDHEPYADATGCNLKYLDAVWLNTKWSSYVSSEVFFKLCPKFRIIERRDIDSKRDFALHLRRLELDAHLLPYVEHNICANI
jgi:hypothetical protein